MKLVCFFGLILCALGFNACAGGGYEYGSNGAGRANAQNRTTYQGVDTQCRTTCNSKGCFRQCTGPSDIIMHLLD